MPEFILQDKMYGRTDVPSMNLFSEVSLCNAKMVAGSKSFDGNPDSLYILRHYLGVKTIHFEVVPYFLAPTEYLAPSILLAGSMLRHPVPLQRRSVENSILLLNADSSVKGVSKTYWEAVI